MKIKVSRKRNTFCQAFFRDCLFDSSVYRIADQMISGYNGGMWKYYEVDNGSAFMALEASDGPFTVSNLISGESVENVPAIITGMIVTAFAMLVKIEASTNDMVHDFLIDQFDKLKDTIVERCSQENRMDIWMGLMD